MSFDRRIVLIGQGATTTDALATLRERFTIAALVRGSLDAISLDARAAGIRVETDTRPRSIHALVEALQPDAVVVSSYDRILPPETIGLCPFINVHYAPLPRYRGRATVNWAILNGEPETAVSVHVLAEELDAGAILAQQIVPIEPRDTVGRLYEKLNRVQRAILADAVARRLAGDNGVAQDETQATYSCTRLPCDGLIDWRASTRSIDRLIRSLGAPFPYAFSTLDGERIEIHQAQPSGDTRRYEGRVPGRVLRVDRLSGTVEVMTGDGVLTLQRLALPGEPPLAAARFVKTLRTTFGLDAGPFNSFRPAPSGRLPMEKVSHAESV